MPRTRRTGVCWAGRARQRGEEETLEQTWRSLGLSETLPPLPLDATITPQKLRALQGRPGPAERPAAVPLDSGPLPRIDVLDPGPGARLVQPPALAPDLEVIETLGQGGMGQVHLARQRSLNRQVAIKRPVQEAIAAADSALLREAVVTGHLEHPNVIPVHALGVDADGRPLIVMKRVAGLEWQSVLAQDAARPSWPAAAPDRLSWHLARLSQVCNAVAFAHSRGLIHRDIKPQNVMVGDFGEVYLVDWGLAMRVGDKDPAGASLLGTPAYMAPEMVRGEALDQRTDVFLLGATLHHVLTGRPRHTGATLWEALFAALRCAPVEYGPDVPAELALLANRATAPAPKERPASVEAFQRELEGYERHRGSMALSSAADQRLAQIQRWLQSDAPDEDPQRMYRALNECRFGFLQALEAWPENQAAEEGLQACLEAALRVEIDHRNPTAARAVLAELPRERPDLAAEIEQLETQLQAEEREQSRLRELARDADPSIGSRLRAPMILLVAGVVLAVAVYALSTKRPGEFSVPHSIGIGGIILAAVLSGVALFRRRLLVNAFSRRLVGWFVLILISVLLNRSTGWMMDTPTPRVLVGDMAIIAAMLGAGGILLYRWLWLGAALFGVNAVVGALWPVGTLGLLVGSSVLTMLLAAYFLSRDRRQGADRRQRAP